MSEIAKNLAGVGCGPARHAVWLLVAAGTFALTIGVRQAMGLSFPR